MIKSIPQVRLTGMLPAAQVDVSKEAEVQLLVQETIKWAGSLDFYINNAVRFIFGNVRAVSDTGEMTSILQLSASQVLKA